MSVDVYWDLRIPNGVGGCLRVSGCAYWCMRMPMGV